MLFSLVLLGTQGFTSSDRNTQEILNSLQKSHSQRKTVRVLAQKLSRVLQAAPPTSRGAF